jgi:hypothetical protein
MRLPARVGGPWATSPPPTAGPAGTPSTNQESAVSELVAYKNTNTDEVHVFDGVNPDLEARNNFVQVDIATVPNSAIRAAQRARAERDSIEASAGIHATRVEVSGQESARAARAGATGGTSTSREPVLASARPADGTHTGEGVLAREGRTGPSRAELEDRAEHERLNPDPRGVLSRPSLASTNAGPAEAAAAAAANDKLAAEGLDTDNGDARRVAASDGQDDAAGDGGESGDTEPGDGQGAVSGVGATDDDTDDDEGDEDPAPPAAKKAAPKKATPKKAAAPAAE